MPESNSEEKPCGIYHPLPCALDVACDVPVEHFDAYEDDASQAAYDRWVQAGGEGASDA